MRPSYYDRAYMLEIEESSLAPARSGGRFFARPLEPADVSIFLGDVATTTCEAISDSHQRDVPKEYSPH